MKTKESEEPIAVLKAIEHKAEHYAGELVISGCFCDGAKVLHCSWCEARALFDTAIARERAACIETVEKMSRDRAAEAKRLGASGRFDRLNDEMRLAEELQLAASALKVGVL